MRTVDTITQEENVPRIIYQSFVIADFIVMSCVRFAPSAWRQKLKLFNPESSQVSAGDASAPRAPKNYRTKRCLLVGGPIRRFDGSIQ